MLCYICVCCLRENFTGMPGPLNSFVLDSSSDELVSPLRPMSFLPPQGVTHDSSSNSSSQNYSPICRRHQEDLINAYEAEEERIINVLSRKLEQVCDPILTPFLDSLTYYLPSSSKMTTSNWKTLSKQNQNPMSTDYRANCPR
jgi:hypothetical protein